MLPFDYKTDTTKHALWHSTRHVLFLKLGKKKLPIFAEYTRKLTLAGKFVVYGSVVATVGIAGALYEVNWFNKPKKK